MPVAGSINLNEAGMCVRIIRSRILMTNYINFTFPWERIKFDERIGLSGMTN